MREARRLKHLTARYLIAGVRVWEALRLERITADAESTGRITPTKDRRTKRQQVLRNAETPMRRRARTEKPMSIVSDGLHLAAEHVGHGAGASRARLVSQTAQHKAAHCGRVMPRMEGIRPRERSMGVPPGTSLSVESRRQSRRSGGDRPRLQGEQTRPGEDVEAATVEIRSNHLKPTDHSLHTAGAPPIATSGPFEMTVTS